MKCQLGHITKKLVGNEYHLNQKVNTYVKDKKLKKKIRDLKCDYDRGIAIYVTPSTRHYQVGRTISIGTPMVWCSCKKSANRDVWIRLMLCVRMLMQTKAWYLSGVGSRSRLIITKI